MAKTILDEVYRELKKMGLTPSERVFCMEWLGRSECYMRTLRFEQLPPSIATIAICASKLQHYGERMVQTEQYKAAGRRFLHLSEQCHAEINRDAEATWLEAV
ncbi:DUF6626 family protein [Spiribacter sp. 218]|uniref:DUF6626 family protein n=1 Tax=Spiribacter pallidus TaxID=1987936 RepID=UPI00349F730F